MSRRRWPAGPAPGTPAPSVGVDTDADAGTGTLQARDLAFRYGSRRVLEGCDLDLAPGELVALLGRNGAGKSTLLRLLLGLLRPQRGEVTLSGRPLAAWSRRGLACRLAYVPQAQAMPFPYPVRDIVLMGRLPADGWIRAPRRADIEAADRWLDRFGIAALALRPCTEISGGERQLALLARALIQGARTLILDEPMSGLDYGRQLQLLQHLRALARDGYSVLMTTHHPEHALLAATRVAVLMRGRIEAEGPPAAIVTPERMLALYDVAVQAFRSPEGHVAFHPLDAAPPA